VAVDDGKGGMALCLGVAVDETAGVIGVSVNNLWEIWELE
jgi:hypothetical protein